MTKTMLQDNQIEMIKKAINVAWPAVLESFFIVLAGMIDTMMVASLGSYAVAAVGLTAQPKFFGLTVFIAITVAVSALVARRKGEARQKSANEILLTALVLTVGLCVIVSLIFVGFAPEIMKIAGSNADTHEAATTYFRVIMGCSFFNVISFTINSGQRGSGNTRIAMVTNVTSSIVNIIFNYLLIGGHFGFPAWGVFGAAVATVLGTVVACILSIASLFRKNSYVSIPYMIRNKLRFRAVAVSNIRHLATSIFVENIVMRIGFLTTAFVAARLGTDQFAAHNIGMNLLGLTFSFADGMQVAAVALSGEALGAGEKQKAIDYGNICQRIGLVISVVLSVLLLLGGRWFFGLYFPNEEHILQDGVMICRFMTVIVLLQITQIIYGACLRAAGDVRYALLASLVSCAIIRSVAPIVLVYVCQMGLAGIWIGILLDQFARFLFMYFRFRQGKWVHIRI